MRAIYNDHRDEPTVVLKRELWAKLLTSALGTQFTNTDELFLEHTLLVNSAEIIAHLVLGLNGTDIAPETRLAGDLFVAAGVYGVVDRDFFDWVIEVPGGAGFISSLARRLSRFDWPHVEHDVLKVLYESTTYQALIRFWSLFMRVDLLFYLREHCILSGHEQPKFWRICTACLPGGCRKPG